MKSVIVSVANVVCWTITNIQPEPPEEHMSDVLDAISADLEGRRNAWTSVCAWVVPGIAKTEQEMVEEAKTGHPKWCYYYEARGKVIEASTNAVLKELPPRKS